VWDKVGTRKGDWQISFLGSLVVTCYSEEDRPGLEVTKVKVKA
jgi:hypothetical protein